MLRIAGAPPRCADRLPPANPDISVIGSAISSCSAEFSRRV